MKLTDFVSLAAIPISILAGAAVTFVGVALSTKKSRLETIKAIKSKNFGATRATRFATLWVLAFYKAFGKNFLSKRQLLTIPIYTMVVSGMFFGIWIFYLYVFQDNNSFFRMSLPITFKQSLSDFYRKGVFATLVIDFIAIQMTKVAIRVGERRGFLSIKFIAVYLLSILICYFIFSFSIHIFRLEDMVSLYLAVAPNDVIPVMPYAPIKSLSSSLSLFFPQTLIHVTSQGLYSTYFMPEPLIFYCAVAAQLSLFLIMLGYQCAIGTDKLKNICIEFVSRIGQPETNANSVIVLMVLWLISIPILALSLLAILGN